MSSKTFEEDQLVQVQFSNGPGSYAGAGYTYRVPAGVRLRVGDVVIVPTSYRGEVPARVSQIGSDYAGPTSMVKSKHAHKYVPLKRCDCGAEVLT